MFRVLGGLTLALALAACGQTSIQNMSSMFTPGLARPEVVVVSNFSFSPDVVLLDKGFAAQLKRKLGKVPPDQQREQLALRVSHEIAGTMVATLNGAGFSAREGGEETIAAEQPTLLITGKVRTIDQGNQTRRKVIGFGAGKSEVAADVVVTHLSSGGKKELLAFTAQAESGRKPGAVATAPAGIAGGLAVSAATTAGGVLSEKLSADVEAEARRLGQAAAQRVITYATEQGWVSKPGT